MGGFGFYRYDSSLTLRVKYYPFRFCSVCVSPAFSIVNYLIFGDVCRFRVCTFLVYGRYSERLLRIAIVTVCDLPFVPLATVPR